MPFGVLPTLIQFLGHKIQGYGFRVQGLESVYSSGFRVSTKVVRSHLLHGHFPVFVKIRNNAEGEAPVSHRRLSP